MLVHSSCQKDTPTHVTNTKKRLGQYRCAFFDVMAAKKRVRYSIDMVFPSEEEKDRFKQRMDDLKTLLSPPGATKHEKIENTQLIFELFELAESQARKLPAAPQTVPQTGSFLQKAGMSVCNIIMIILITMLPL